MTGPRSIQWLFEADVFPDYSVEDCNQRRQSVTR